MLKALIVRISNGSVIVPKGLFKLNEERENEIEYEDEFKMPEFQEQSNLENWCHVNPNIL